jgi:hypothetical protein
MIPSRHARFVGPPPKPASRPQRAGHTRCFVDLPKVMRILAAAGFLVAALAGCWDPEEEPLVVYVGAAHEGDGDVSVAFAVADDAVMAYACSDDPTYAEYPGWFDGPASTVPVARLEREDWTFFAAWGPDGADGRLVDRHGDALPWHAERVPPGSLAGLYAVHDSGCTTGVIVIDGSPEPIVRGTWCSADGEIAQVTPVRPIELVDDRLAVEVALEHGTRRLYAPRVTRAW